MVLGLLKLRHFTSVWWWYIGMCSTLAQFISGLLSLYLGNKIRHTKGISAGAGAKGTWLWLPKKPLVTASPGVWCRWLLAANQSHWAQIPTYLLCPALPRSLQSIHVQLWFPTSYWIKNVHKLLADYIARTWPHWEEDYFSNTFICGYEVLLGTDFMILEKSWSTREKE